MGGGRLEHPQETPGKTGVDDETGAFSGALLAETVAADPDLLELVTAWPALPAAVKAEILAAVRGAGG